LPHARIVRDGARLVNDAARSAQLHTARARKLRMAAHVPTMPRMAYLLGVVRGLDACSSPSGTFTVLALDHRQNLRKELRPADPAAVTGEEMVEFKQAVVRALGTVGTGVLLDPEIGVGPAVADGSLPGRA